jgi:hypothetical protein
MHLVSSKLHDPGECHCCEAGHGEDAHATTKCDGVEAQVGNEKRCLKPKDNFTDCPDCPEMVIVPAGYTMGSPANEPQRASGEEQVRVTIPAAAKQAFGCRSSFL